MLPPLDLAQDLHAALVTPTLVSPSLPWPDTMRGLNTALGNGGLIELAEGLEDRGLQKQQQQQRPQPPQEAGRGLQGGAVQVKAEKQVTVEWGSVKEGQEAWSCASADS